MKLINDDIITHDELLNLFLILLLYFGACSLSLSDIYEEVGLMVQKFSFHRFIASLEQSFFVEYLYAC